MGWSSHETLGVKVKMSVPFFCDTDVSFLILYSKGLFVFMQRNLSKSRGKKTYYLILLSSCLLLPDELYDSVGFGAVDSYLAESCLTGSV